MAFILATFAALFWLLNAASCAPAGVQDACADLRISSMELNRIARNVSHQARNGSTNVADFSTSLVWMEAKDMCDPETLRLKSTTCTEKIFTTLRSYNSVLESIHGSCSEFVDRVKPALRKLHEDMSRCVKSKGEKPHHHKESNINVENREMQHWQKPLMCQYTMDRLFSFSILTARVFAVGDPSHHGEGSAQTCM